MSRKLIDLDLIFQLFPFFPQYFWTKEFYRLNKISKSFNARITSIVDNNNADSTIFSSMETKKIDEKIKLLVMRINSGINKRNDKDDYEMNRCLEILFFHKDEKKSLTEKIMKLMVDCGAKCHRVLNYDLLRFKCLEEHLINFFLYNLKHNNDPICSIDPEKIIEFLIILYITHHYTLQLSRFKIMNCVSSIYCEIKRKNFFDYELDAMMTIFEEKYSGMQLELQQISDNSEFYKPSWRNTDDISSFDYKTTTFGIVNDFGGIDKARYSLLYGTEIDTLWWRMKYRKPELGVNIPKLDNKSFENVCKCLENKSIRSTILAQQPNILDEIVEKSEKELAIKEYSITWGKLKNILIEFLIFTLFILFVEFLCLLM
jgi:hypothetical protein